MTQEFNLSEEIWEIDNDNVVHTDDIKEFIRLLKEEFTFRTYTEYNSNEIKLIIDKLAGEKLIWNVVFVEKIL